MAELTQEQFEQVPEFLQVDYEKVGDAYQHKAEGKATALKASMNDLNGKFKASEGRIADIETQRQADIEAAKAQALAEAGKSGDQEAWQSRHEEILADANKRHNEALDAVKAENQVLADVNKTSKRQSILADTREKLGIFPEQAKIFDRVVGPMIDIDPATGGETFLSDDGSATSLDRAGFYSQLEGDEAFSRMRKAEPPSSGGIAKGNNSAGGAQQKQNTAAEAAKSKGDLNGFLQASLKSN